MNKLNEETKNQIEEITQEELKAVGVEGLEDAPGLSKEDMQAKFEETSKALIVPRLNMLIKAFNQLVSDVGDLALGAGQVTPEQIKTWNAKLDATAEGLRTLTKCCMIGGSSGWIKFGEVALSGAFAAYSAMLEIQSAHTESADEKSGVAAVYLQLSADGTALTEKSRITWLSICGYTPECIAAVYDAATETARLYIQTSAVTERIRISVSGESNAGNYDSLLATEDNSAAELTALADDALYSEENIRGIKMTKLWENASPTSEFAAQTVALDLSDYDAVLVKCVSYAKYAIDDANRRERTFIGFIGDVLELSINTRTDRWYLSDRTGMVGVSGIEFSAGAMWYSSSEIAQRADTSAPLEIYGIKGVAI